MATCTIAVRWSVVHSGKQSAMRLSSMGRVTSGLANLHLLQAVPILLNMQGSSVLQILPSPVNPGFLMLSLFPSLQTHGLPASSRIRDHSCDENHGLDKHDALKFHWENGVKWCDVSE
jgi:hypothetical protein